ncbi:unnamed protein product [Paramecium primaurelia]|uniref:Uncharacterized protein n=1 Tax=Paramecium primaurelia TaxID=5886 RepID=A0A8S1QY62_PARPR|nr:unnamed protein product [Paramecium primaurelia]
MKQSTIRSVNQLNFPFISHFTQQTSGSGVFDQSGILEEIFQLQLMMLDNVEQLKSLSQTLKQILTETNLHVQCQVSEHQYLGRIQSESYEILVLQYYHQRLQISFELQSLLQ